MNTLKFCGTNMTPEMRALVEKAKTEFTNVDVSVDLCAENHRGADYKYSAVANGTMVSGDTTHVLFERIKNIIGEAKVAVDETANQRGEIL